MTMTAADVLVEVLQWGVKHIFGLPGGAVKKLLRRRRDQITLADAFKEMV